ncbi:hypothetical protein GW17_00039666 [Ensete ventricosum]|nr:hypothetical protein GW17_00039666 [Ensete ventricosum]
MVNRLKGILPLSRAIRAMTELWLVEAGLRLASRGIVNFNVKVTVRKHKSHHGEGSSQGNTREKEPVAPSEEDSLPTYHRPKSMKDLYDMRVRKDDEGLETNLGIAVAYRPLLDRSPGVGLAADSLKLVGIGLSCISGVKGEPRFKLSPVSSFYLVTSFCTSSKRRFTCRSYARSESVESDDKVLGSHGVCSALRWCAIDFPGTSRGASDWVSSEILRYKARLNRHYVFPRVALVCMRLLGLRQRGSLHLRQLGNAAVETAIALLFLHQAKLELLVHRDPKRANILDGNYLRKISNVGPTRMVYR